VHQAEAYSFISEYSALYSLIPRIQKGAKSTDSFRVFGQGAQINPAPNTFLEQLAVLNNGTLLKKLYENKQSDPRQTGNKLLFRSCFTRKNIDFA
jgi:hypothetical protein